MHLKEVKLENFRCFEALTLHPHKRLNVFVGVNASGKSALLKGIAKSLNGILYVLSGKDISLIEDDDIRLRQYEDNVQAQFPVNAGATLISEEEAMDWNVRKSSFSADAKDGKENHFRLEPYPDNLLANWQKKAQENTPVEFPVISFYSTARLWEEGKHFDYSKYGERQRGYNYCLNSGIFRESFDEWFKKHELVRAQKVLRHEKHTAWELDFIRNLVIGAIPSCQNLYYDIKTESIYFKDNAGSALPLALLSDGTLSLLSIVTDIALRCTLLNPHLKDRANESPGFVLIDEIDLHLHPEWQRRAIKILQNAFPNIQFFLTTHSPQVISTVPRESVFVVKDFEVNPLNAYTEGRDSNAILQEVFGVEKRPAEYQEKLNAVYEAIEKKEIDKAQSYLNELEKYLGENDPAMLRADIYFTELLEESEQ